MLKQCEKILLVLALCAATLGCVSPEEEARIKKEQADHDIHECLRYGFVQGTTPFAQCRMEADLARQHPVYYDYDSYPPAYNYGGLMIRH